MPKPVVQAANMGISRRQLPTMQCEKGHEGAHRNTKPRPLISARQQASKQASLASSKIDIVGGSNGCNLIKLPPD